MKIKHKPSDEWTEIDATGIGFTTGSAKLKMVGFDTGDDLSDLLFKVVYCQYDEEKQPHVGLLRTQGSRFIVDANNK